MMATIPIGATLFDLPNTPDEFGVVLPPANLRRLDFSGLDFTTARRAMLEYVKTYFPNDFNDFVASNGLMMFIELVASAVGKLSLRGDILANSATLPTAQTEKAVVNHLALINQRIKRQTPAVVDVAVSVDHPAFTDIEVDPGTSFNTTGPDGSPIVYEIYRAPGDWASKIIIPASKRGVVAYGLEGQFASPVVVTSAGGPDQVYTVQDDNILESPVFVTITVGDTTEDWLVVTDPIERYQATDKVVEVVFIDASAQFRFGDNVTGKSPASGSTIQFKYRVGGGIRGRIGVGQIDTVRQVAPLPPANAVTSVRFTNLSPSSGGTDRESLEDAKRRAPRDFALQRSIVTAEDYAQAAQSFSHPVFGAIAKSIATLRSGKNANRVEIYVLADGPDGLPVAPNAGLKAGLVTYFNDLNVLTDSVVVLDGALKSIDIEMTVVFNRNADASVVKGQVENTISDFFNIANWQMGAAFYYSNFVAAVNAIDGVSFVDVSQPQGNVLPTGQIADTANKTGIGFNELIVEGTRKINYYYEKIPPPGGIRSGQ